MVLKHIDPNHLNSNQIERLNFQKVSSILADYGFATIWLDDDWKSADFLAKHIDGETYLSVQLKSRLTFDKKYAGKNIWIAFSDKSDWYLFPHDEMLAVFEIEYPKTFSNTKSWKGHGGYSWPRLDRKKEKLVAKWKIQQNFATFIIHKKNQRRV